MDILKFYYRSPFHMIRILLAGVIIVLTIIGCASKGPLPEIEKLDYKSRVVTSSDGAVLVSASVLSADESRDIYGAPLAKKGIQPVWIEVENGDDVAYWLMSPGLDPNFYPASEAVEAFITKHGNETSEMLVQRFESLAFRNPIPPGKTVSGFVLVNLDHGVKMVQVDLVANRRHRSFSIFAVVPGFRSDYRGRQGFTREQYADDEVINYTDENAFRSALEALPCCVTNKNGTRNGDPLNLVVVGATYDVFPALVRRGWGPTEQTWTGSVLKMMKSAMSGDRYPYAPISPLYLYDRPQDLALQKARDNIHQRNHLRLWLSPMRYHDKDVWVGQISRDIGSRFTIHSLYLTTHKIDPDVDEARTALQEDMVYSQSLVKLGLVKGVGGAPKDEPRRNLTTDPYYTDGLRSVLMFDSHPTSLTDIQFLPWDDRAGGFIEQSTRQQRP
ncbi:MAG: LssY C-terminal domain-containing protein [Desulfobulbales bacterium]